MHSFLIDTQFLWWWLKNSKKLKDTHYTIIENPENKIVVSICSLFEIYIKVSIGRLALPGDLQKAMEINDFSILPMDFRHFEEYRTLPLHHRDPF